MSTGYVSAGASTAVFTAVGLITAHTWQIRRSHHVPGWRRAAPLVGGIMLLAWLGTEGENTDVLSHGLGFAAGLLLGALTGTPAGTRLLKRLLQPIAAAAALVWMAGCWALALL